MRALNRISHSLLALFALVVLASVALAQPGAVAPGTIVPATSGISDQKAGSVLVFNLVTSTATGTDDTLVQITNTNSAFGIAVHVFLVDGATCNVIDIAICLTKNQTICFRASELDPGTRGFLVAVASNPFTGCPIGFNFLIGDEFVRVTVAGTTFQGQLGAEAIANLGPFGAAVACDVTGTTAQICFDGLNFNLAPRVLAASSVLSPADAATWIVINRLAGDLRGAGGFGVGTLFALIFDDRENAVSFTVPGGVCQTAFFPSLASFRNNLFGRFLARGTCGWLRIQSTSDIGISGAIFTQSATGLLNGAVNLHKLSLSGGVVSGMGGMITVTGGCFTVPVFQICDDAPFAGTE